MPKLAQLNIAKTRYPLDDIRMKVFVDNLETINQLAEESAGFLWRLKDDSGNATSIQGFDDPMIIPNLSVWRDVDSLKHFVYQTAHVEFLKQRASWFENLAQSHYVLWWIEDNEMPSLDMAKKRLALLREKGDTKDAFSFKKPFAY